MVAVAVIGAGGVIGSAIARRLAMDGHRVRAVSRAECDLALPASCAALDLAGCEALVQAGGITEESARTATAWAHAATGWQAVLDRAKAADVKRVVYVSSAHIYGTLEGSIDETSAPDPRGDYALLHYASEQILRRNGFAGAILRAGNVYGMPTNLDNFARWALVPYGFPQEAAQAKRITLKSPGLQMRNFVPSSGIAAAVARELAGNAPALDVINVAGNDTLSMRDFAARVAGVAKRVLGFDITLDMPPAPPNAPAALRFVSRLGPQAGDLDAFLADMLRACATTKES
jgi:UDP-glucose 4-epimerase